MSSCKPCKYTMFDGVFKTSVDKKFNYENLLKIQKVFEKNNDKSMKGLVAIAFNDGVEFILINNDNGYKVVSNYKKFENLNSKCAVVGEILNGISEVNKDGYPTYLVTNINIPCCELNAKKYGNFYQV